MGADQSQDAVARCEALMKNEPEESVVVHEDSTAVVMYDPSSMFEAPRKRRISWRDLREFNASCKKRLVRATRGASRVQFEEHQAEQCVELPLEIYSEARAVLLSASCTTCSHVAASPSDLLRHERTHSGEKPYPCDECGESFARSHHLLNHRRLHDGEKPYICECCGAAFTQSGVLKIHMRTHNGDKPYVCDMCGKCFAQNSHLRVHERVHNGDKPYPCGECDKRFRTSGHLRVHVRVHSGEKPYTCGQCAQTFAHNGSLRSHERMHSGEKPFGCIVCDQTFARSDHLRNHERTHSGEKPFKCEQCSQTFSQSSHLRKHKRTHNGEKAFSCGECGKMFSRRDALHSHERTHSGEKPFVCEVCGHFFAQSGDLRKHARTHNGEKPFACEECGKTFSQSGQLRTHERTHSGEKPFACGHCDRTFSQSGHRLGHERLHDRPSNFSCEYQDHSPEKYNGVGLPCGTFFASETSLGFHIREMHDKAHVFKMPAELAVREELKLTFGEAMQHDWQNYMSLGSCESVGNSSYRFDFRTPAPEDFEMLVVTEVDEFQHRRYPCDLKRMLHAAQILMQEFPDTPIVFVRWNPDPRKIGTVHFNVPLKERVKMLMRVLQNEAVLEDGKKMSDLVIQGLNVIYMYYDLERVGGALDTRVCMLNGVADENAENSATVRSCVIAAM